MKGTHLDMPAISHVIDPNVPNPARIYDYWLGGTTFPVDRKAGDTVRRISPNVVSLARQNREFLGRLVRFLAHRGVNQFLDLGSGLPTQNNVHQVAGRIRPDTRVVYVDNDPVVLAHTEALLDTSRDVVAIQADLRNADTILHDPEVRMAMDFSKPSPSCCFRSSTSSTTPGAHTRSSTDCTKQRFPEAIWRSPTERSTTTRRRSRRSMRSSERRTVRSLFDLGMSWLDSSMAWRWCRLALFGPPHGGRRARSQSTKCRARSSSVWPVSPHPRERPASTKFIKPVGHRTVNFLTDPARHARRAACTA
jgi:hypothetical protein